MIAYQARSFGNEQPKYYTIILDSNSPKIFGLDRVDITKRIYTVEGPLDSLFLDNAVAVGSSALLNFDDFGLDVVYIFDNEKRNPEIMKIMGKAIISGKKVVILPKSWIYKDLNEAVQGGVNLEELKNIVDENIYSGMAAKLRFNQWKRS